MGELDKLRLWRLAFLSFAVTAALAALPFAFKASAQFLGRDVSALAVGIMGFYPWIAVAEAAKVLGLTWALTFSIMLVTVAACRQLPGSKYVRGCCLAAPLVGYATWLAASVIRYPAIYDEALSEPMKDLVFHAAFYLSPTMLSRFAGLMFVLAPAWLLVIALMRGVRVVGSQPRWKAWVAISGSLVVVGSFVAAKIDGAKGQAISEGRPNVIVIGVDSLRVDRLRDSRVTPNISALLSDPQTVNFEDHFVGVPRTFPSWIEMIQGKYAAKTGIRHMFPSFGDRSHTKIGMVTAFRDAGYKTMAISDFAGDIFPRFDGGFDEIEAPKLTLRTMIKMTIDRSFPLFMPLIASAVGQWLFPALRESPAYADPVWLSQQAIAALEERGAPMFLTVFFSTAHFPYAAPYPHYNSFAQQDYKGSFRFEKNPESGLRTGSERLADIQQVQALYDGAVASVDREVGRIVSKLKQQGTWDNTILVITADHGEDLYDDGLGQGHGEHLRGRNVLQVPFLIKMPHGVSVVKNKFEFISRSIDVASTVVGAAGLSRSNIGDGVNLMPWIRGEASADPELLAYSETELWFERTGEGFFQKKRLDYPGISGLLDFDQGYSGEIVLNPVYDDVVVTAKHRMVADARYKLIYMPTSKGIEYELYDRRADPQNKIDLAQKDPATLALMIAKLESWIGANERKYKLASGYVVRR